MNLNRLLARLEELPEPVVQVWGWPGSGSRALLEAVLERYGEKARALALAEVESEERLRETLRDPAVAAARWLVAFELPAAAAATAARLLRPGQRLLVSGRRRLTGDPLPVSYLTPPERQLTEDEIAGAAVPESKPGFRLHLLGPPRVVAWSGEGSADDGDGHEVRWKLRRSLKVLLYLATAPDFRASRDDLIAALWPEDSAEVIRRNFHPTLSYLRRALTEAWPGPGPLPPPLIHLNRTYRLNPEIDWWVDTVELAGAVEEGRSQLQAGDAGAALAVWERAARLYRGPYLQGIYDRWAEGDQESYLRTFLELLEELGEVYAEAERWTEALDAYRRVLIEDPLREPVHVALMTIYARQGRRDLVRRQYDRLRALLVEELGVEPLAETNTAFHRLMGSLT